jgi:hypothetical protein
MMQADTDQYYTTSFTVDRSPQEAFAAVNDPRAWWSQEITGVTDQAGAEFQHRYQDVHRCTIRVTELVPGRKVVWRVVDNYFNFVEDQAEWKDTEIVFEISETAGGAEVRFTHVGLVRQYECYDVCSNAWGGYLDGSLRDLINTGAGRPNPKEDGDAPAHQDAATAARAQRSPRAGASTDTGSDA